MSDDETPSNYDDHGADVDRLTAQLATARKALEEARGALEASFGFVTAVWAGTPLDSRAELSAHDLKVRIVNARNAVAAALDAPAPLRPLHVTGCTKPDCDCKPCPCGDTDRPGHPLGMWCVGGRRRWRELHPVAGEPWTCPACGRQTSADNADCPSCGALHPLTPGTPGKDGGT